MKIIACADRARAVGLYRPAARDQSDPRNASGQSVSGYALCRNGRRDDDAGRVLQREPGRYGSNCATPVAIIERSLAIARARLCINYLVTEKDIPVANNILAIDDRAAAEERAAQPSVHFAPSGLSDWFALGFTKLLRFTADTFFAKRYGHRAIVLETVAAVPGMVGAMFTHLTSLRSMKDDEGWIRILMEEAENERMHLMTFIEIAKPTLFERLVILTAQWIFLVLFSILYLVSSRTAHRVVGYFEEEAVTSYTLYLKEIDEGRSPNVAAPSIAKHYWKMAEDATLRDVILVVRADEAHHRDVNHGFASKLAGRTFDAVKIAPYPAHADDVRPNRDAQMAQLT